MNEAAKFQPDPAILLHIQRVAMSAMNRAKRKGWSYKCKLPEFARTLYEVQRGRCALTGRFFQLTEHGSGMARRPFAPSLDRIDSTGGYTQDNVRLVCQAVNFALNAWGEDVFLNLVRAAADYVGRPPDAMIDGPPDQKVRYIDYVVAEAPRLLAEAGGTLPKAELRRTLRERYIGALPRDLGNAYGWAFRRLTEQGVLRPSSESEVYQLATPCS